MADIIGIIARWCSRWWIFPLLNGARITISLTILAVSAGLILSLFIALGKMSRHLFRQQPGPPA